MTIAIRRPALGSAATAFLAKKHDGARLHLITHSRGGLIAEALARVAAGQGLRDEDRAIFNDVAYGEHRANLDKLATLAKQRSFRVERLVRVGLPSPRHAARVAPPRRLPLSAEMGPQACRRSRCACDRRLSRRDRAPPRRSGQAAGTQRRTPGCNR